MSQVINVSRRGFLVGLAGAGALILGAQTVPKLLWAKKSGNGSTHADEATLHPNVFVGIDTDGTVYIVAHRSEMGTVIRTSLPLVVADELEEPVLLERELDEQVERIAEHRRDHACRRQEEGVRRGHGESATVPRPAPARARCCH